MPGVNGFINLRADFRFSGTAIGKSTPTLSAMIDKIIQFQTGSGALGRADMFYHAERQLAASASENLDLTGALSGPLGGTVTQAEVMALIIAASEDNANNVRFGPAAANGFLGPFNAAADRLNIEPGQAVFLTSVNGWPVVAGTGDLLALTNAGAGSVVDYEIIIIGRTVAG